MQSLNRVLTLQDKDPQVAITSSSNIMEVAPNHSENQDETSKSIQQKCYLLHKLLARQINPDLSNIPSPRLKPFRAFGSILDKSLPTTELFPHSGILRNSPAISSNHRKLHLYGPFARVGRDGPSSIDQRSTTDDKISIFGAMSVSFKTDFLQSCAAALLRRRVSKRKLSKMFFLILTY